MPRFDRQTHRARPGIAAWSGLLALVFLQLQLASHLDVDHATLDDYGDTCEVCLKLNAAGSAPAADQPQSTVPVTADAFRVPETVRPATNAGVRPGARAPPSA